MPLDRRCDDACLDLPAALEELAGAAVDRDDGPFTEDMVTV